MNKTVLLVAFHFPPADFSSGIQRTLSLARYLPALGWRPVVLTAWPAAYPSQNAVQIGDVPAAVRVYRAPALDSGRHLAPFGRYPQTFAMPDRWTSWSMGARLIGRRILEREKPDVIWSTYPIATALKIGRWLRQRSGLPWVADFRDSMVDRSHPVAPDIRRVYLEIEAAAVREAQLCTFTAPGAVRMYRERYPEYAEKFTEVANGYDEGVFRERMASGSAAQARSAGEPIVLLHSGTLYPSERDPRALFDAIAELKRAGAVSSHQLRLNLRATAHDTETARLVAERDIGDIVSILPPVDYRTAVSEMLAADALLLLQARNCNHQIPAKLYEYARCRRPVLALTDPAGDTAAAVRRGELGTVVPLDDRDAVAKALPGFLADVRKRPRQAVDENWLRDHSREALATHAVAALDRASERA